MKRLHQFLSAVLLFVVVLAPAQASLKDLELQKVSVNGVDLAWTEVGDPEGTPLLLIMGLGGSHRLWGDPFVESLSQAGYRVILFDNRDVGASQRFNEDGQPVIWWNVLKNTMGLPVSARYTLKDMAADTVALMDELELKDVHLVGASMGGMIAQIVAADYPARTRSLISIMSTTGASHLPTPGKGDTDKIEELAESDEDYTQKLNDRGFYPNAIPRHIMAVLDAGDRSESVKTIKAKTLVIHGVDDTLLPLEHGEHTAEIIPSSTFVSFEGMGHNLPETVLPDLIKSIQAHLGS